MISLITGAGRRGQVGQAVAAALARRGDTVLLVARSPDDAADRARELASEGHSAHGYGCDLSNAVAVGELASRVREEHGDRLDCLVNLAGGFAPSGPIAQSSTGEFERLLEINATTAYLASRAFFPSVQAARGAIVYFASELVFEGTRTSGNAAYLIAKSAVIALMRSVADEGRERGVRANALAPASIRTATNEAEMGSGVKYVEREDVGAAVAFLTSPDSRAITGQIIRLRHA